MPVYTGPPVPLAQHTTTVLDTAGPFARRQLTSPPEQPAERAGASDATIQSSLAAPADVPITSAGAPGADRNSAVLQTVNLTFSYPGIGAGPAVSVHITILDLQSHILQPCFKHSCPRNPLLVVLRQSVLADGRPLPGVPPVVKDMSIELPRGARCLLIGPNGEPPCPSLAVTPLATYYASLSTSPHTRAYNLGHTVRKLLSSAASSQ